jgi:hypothetical protein
VASYKGEKPGGKGPTAATGSSEISAPPAGGIAMMRGKRQICSCCWWRGSRGRQRLSPPSSSVVDGRGGPGCMRAPAAHAYVSTWRTRPRSRHRRSACTSRSSPPLGKFEMSPSYEYEPCVPPDGRVRDDRDVLLRFLNLWSCAN